MGCVTRSAFWISALGLCILLVAFLLPLWLGRSIGNDQTSFYGLFFEEYTRGTEFIGLFYRISCSSVLCDVDDQVLNSESVTLEGQEQWNVNIIAVPVLVTISMFFSVLACCFLEAIRCGWMHGSHKIRRILLASAFLLLVSVIVGALGFVVAVYMADLFYRDDPVSHLGEYPWAIMFLGIALVLLITGCMLHFIISCRWFRYCKYYGCRTPWYHEIDESESSRKGSYTVSEDSRRPRSIEDSLPRSGFRGIAQLGYGSGGKQLGYGGVGHSSYDDTVAYKGLGGGTQSGYGMPSFTFNGIHRNEESMFYEPNRSSSYSDFRASRSSKRSNSADDLRYLSRGSLHDSPKILRSSRMPDFIHDENDFLQQSRKPNSGGLDVTRLSTRDRYDQPIVRHSYSDMDIHRATRNEPSVLDILYRDSRKAYY